MVEATATNFVLPPSSATQFSTNPNVDFSRALRPDLYVNISYHRQRSRTSAALPHRYALNAAKFIYMKLEF